VKIGVVLIAQTLIGKRPALLHVFSSGVSP
jgi:hypothetical protein